MKNIFVLIILISSFTLACRAEESVYIPGQKIRPNNNKIIIDSDSFESDFGKPKFFDPMYYNYFLDDPKYKLFYNYPAFYLPVVRGKSK